MTEELSPKPEELLPEGELAAEQANQPGETEATIGGAATAEVAGEAATTEQHEAGAGAAEQEPQHLGTVEHGEEGTSEDEIPEGRETADQAAHEGEEGRWDHDKAETLGVALQARDKEAKEDGREGIVDESFKRLMRHRNPTIEDVEDRWRNARINLENEEREKQPLAGDDPDYEYVPTVQAIEDRSAIDAAEKDEWMRQRAYREADSVLKPWEDLYDMNPELFATMKPDEFMDIGKDVFRQEKVIEWDQKEGLTPIQKRIDMIDAALEAGEMTDDLEEELEDYLTRETDRRWRRASERGSDNPIITDNTLIRSLGVVLVGFEHGTDNKDRGLQIADEAKKEGEEWLHRNTFDVTPRQQLEAAKEIILKYGDMVRAKHESRKQQLDDTLAKYRPKSEPDGSPERQAA